MSSLVLWIGWDGDKTAKSVRGDIGLTRCCNPATNEEVLVPRTAQWGEGSVSVRWRARVG